MNFEIHMYYIKDIKQSVQNVKARLLQLHYENVILNYTGIFIQISQ